MVYKPFRFFLAIGAVLFVAGTLIGIRFLWHYLAGDCAGHIQSLILAAVFLISGLQTILVAFLADVLAANRKMLEDVNYQIKNAESDKSIHKKEVQ